MLPLLRELLDLAIVVGLMGYCYWLGRERHAHRLRKAEAEARALAHTAKLAATERDEARAEARRHLEHLRIAHPDHFTPNVLGERLCGCGGQWPCPAPPECPHCEGSRFEPGTEVEGDWDSAAKMHHPYTGEPCSACNGTGKTTPADT